MSWQDYVDSSLCSSGIISHGAILSLAGDSVWAKSEGFDIKPEEMPVLASIAKNDTDAMKDLFTKGLYICGERYSLVQAPVGDQPAYCRHAIDPNDENAKMIGVVIGKSTQAIVVGRHNHEKFRQNATPVVDTLVKYLIGVGY